MTPQISIVIVGFGRREVTARCLESLRACYGERLGDEIELVLVDNRSPDDTLALFQTWSPCATVVALEHNRNFAGGCNAGAAAAHAPTLIFLNNDTIVVPGMLDSLAGEVADRGAGVAGLRLLYLDGTLQHAGVGMLTVPSGLAVPHHLFHHQHGELAAARVAYELDVVTGACLAIGRELFAQLGGFDEGYANGWEDVDLCLRVRVAGRTVVYRGDLWLWHDEGQTRGRVVGADANAQRFYGRWGSVLGSDEELVDTVFGGRLPDPHLPPLGVESAELALSGMIRGVSGCSAEARGLLAACHAAGRPAAAREPMPEMVLADSGPDLGDELLRAFHRRPIAEALELHVPVEGRAAPHIGHPAPAAASASPGLILRLARLPERVADLPVLAASPALATALVAAGLAPDRVDWLAPCVPTGRVLPARRPLLVMLGAHDLPAAETALGALAPWEADDVAVLVTARSRPLLELVARRLPRAEILGPCTSETRLRDLIGGFAVVVDADPDDVFERRSLIAAGAGALPVSTEHGAAHAVLGDLAVPAGEVSVHALRDAVTRALARPTTGREERSAAVERHCSAPACGRRLAELLGLPVLARAA